ncbi:hypothetical protein RHMOL_Rhmol02G0060600 [Rhododendron molle]|uniref:Uncharacterized protein n=1 Tax=Rhododendron molle TaxID=49168 RepID=A0ACC0PLS3_RHOML|nr:hypothetical protein RHMOL_Rhmol02G0060600 [Rhododendron molle]
MTFLVSYSSQIRKQRPDHSTIYGSTGSSSNYPEPIKTNQTPRKPIPGPAEVSAPLIENLLPEIIFEILSRLPVKSLLRFRCVSKSWRSMISDPKFAKAHLSLASTKPDYAHHRLLLLSLLSREFAVKSCSLHAILQEHSDTAVDLDYPLKAPHSTVSIYDFCNGFNVEVMMYTLKTDSWRSLVEFSNCLPPFGSGICVNGVLHWTASGESHMVIVSLDLVKETFGEVLLPDYRDGHSQLMLHVVINWMPLFSL